jgi:hypothetical protein
VENEDGIVHMGHFETKSINRHTLYINFPLFLTQSHALIQWTNVVCVSIKQSNK